MLKVSRIRNYAKRKKISDIFIYFHPHFVYNCVSVFTIRRIFLNVIVFCIAIIRNVMVNIKGVFMFYKLFLFANSRNIRTIHCNEC